MNKIKQQGALLIIVLWFAVIATILITVLAGEVRLSTKIVLYNKIGLQAWNDTLQALQVAKMEIAINHMPDPPGMEDVPLSERKNKKYRFDGRILNDLAYSVPNTVMVRIYNHAGKINLSRLSKFQLRRLLKNKLGDDLELIASLKDAWNDWLDRDDDERLNGAEEDYYAETQIPVYKPRNGPIETVRELLLIKGFAELLKGVDLENTFTMYSNISNLTINPNLATREALMMLPGMSADIADIILTQRYEEEFKNYGDFNEFIEPEQLAELRGWFNFSTSNKYYTIAIQIKSPAEISQLISAEDDESQEDVKIQPPTKNQQAYMVTVE